MSKTREREHICLTYSCDVCDTTTPAGTCCRHCDAYDEEPQP